MRYLFTTFFCLFTIIMSAQLKIEAELYASGFNEPLDIVVADDERLFIVERAGVIKILYPDLTTATFMDITTIVGSTGGEQGLLGLAFHPNYAENGYFYVNYTDLAGDTHISRFSRSAGDPEQADAGSEFNLLMMDQPAANHNGGDLNFGPDGYLYISMGDGGGAGHNRSQDITDNKLGKILRIDVDGDSPYANPSDNHFVGVTGDDEIWAMGLRNPWRSSFDRVTGDFWIADVGADSWEEINVIKADTSEFMNFGWKCYEGNMLREGTLCDTVVPDFDFPVFVYPHNIDSGGFAVTGGYVYRGTNFPELYGRYIFCDYISGNFWTLTPDGAGGYIPTFYDYVLDHITSFGEDIHGEIFACVNDNGNIYKIIDACAGFDATLDITNANAPTINNGAINVTEINGTSPFNYSWNTGATTQDISGLNAGEYIVTITDNNGCSITKSAMVENNCSAATGITSAPTATSVFINWDDVGATGYRVLYKPVGPGAYTQVNAPISSITISGLLPNTAYTFKIRNKCPGAPGSFSANGNFITLPLKTTLTVNEIQLFPNPGSGLFTITGVHSQLPVTLIDMQGKTIGSFVVAEGGMLDLTGVSAGMYRLLMPELNISLPIIIIK
jgi:glucose/arabinose dehydrogenase